MIQEAIHNLTQAEMETHERARMLRAEALRNLAEAFRDVLLLEQALNRIAGGEGGDGREVSH
jgi:IS5 family transposase